MSFQTLLPLCILLLHLHGAYSHGLMTDPPQRGTLNPGSRFNDKPINDSAPIDFFAHFPAGDKSTSPGAALRSQIRAVPDWTPFTPTSPGFRWRAGVCGDEIGKKQDHLRGGQYYNGQIVRTYRENDFIQVEVNIIANHNGFIETHLCDIEKCGGEISEECFQKGHCHHLLRAKDASCDSRFNRQCAPIDPDYPHRWYLPCSTKPENTAEIMGGPRMKFQLPEGVACDHCVLHWFWTAANTCNPPGVIEFFEGSNGPKNWGECPGQGGARGGYTKVQKDCGPDRFPEEYYQCADVRVTPKKGSPGYTPMSTMPVTTTPVTTPPPTRPRGYDPEMMGSVFREFTLVADGEEIRSLPDGVEVDISKYEQVAIEAVTNKEVSKVIFYIDGEDVWTDFVRPYFMFGNSGRVPRYWSSPIVNRSFNLRVEADGQVMEKRIKFVKQ